MISHAPITGGKSGCISDFIEDRLMTAGNNPEQLEAFMHELYTVALQIVLVSENGFSPAAVGAFPIIADKDYSLAKTQKWILCLRLWESDITPEERDRFGAVHFHWS